MSIKHKLEYGIYPIASRRHQPRDNWGSFQKFPHEYTKDEASLVLGSWIISAVILGWAFFTAKSNFINVVVVVCLWIGLST
jgi:hypothetical protein